MVHWLSDNITFSTLRRAALASLLGLSGLHVRADAESLTYNARIGQETRLATVTVVSVEGQPCVSLKGLVSGLGGQVKVSQDSVQISLMNGSATLTIGDTEVAASQKFTLQHPPRVYENDIYIAVSDVTSLFVYAFNLEVKTGQPDQSAMPTQPSGRKLRVVLDAGHGGTDPGASGKGATPEKIVARTIAGRVATLVEPACQPVFTRAEDETLTSTKRVSMANVDLKGDLLVSIHVGASASQTANGFEFFCPMGAGDPNSSRALALARSMSNAMAQSTGLTPRGVRQAPFRIFTNLQIPGVLVEVGFITNPNEENLLLDAGHQEKIAQGVANGILAYISGKAQ